MQVHTTTHDSRQLKAAPEASSTASLDSRGVSSRLRAVAVHLLASLLVAGLAGYLLFRLWYPGPWAELAGGTALFWIVLGVDVVMGPLITLVVFNPVKPRAELMRDMAVVAGLQLAALAYGLSTVYQARPAVLALEGSRIRAIKPIELTAEQMAKAPAGSTDIPLTSMMKVAARKATSAQEGLDFLDQALQGRDVGMRPELWLPPAQAVQAWKDNGLPLSELKKKQPDSAAAIDAALAKTGVSPEHLRYLPILARESNHVALVDVRSGDIVGYAPVDGF
jgi:hypothetical protein